MHKVGCIRLTTVENRVGRTNPPSAPSTPLTAKVPPSNTVISLLADLLIDRQNVVPLGCGNQGTHVCFLQCRVSHINGLKPVRDCILYSFHLIVGCHDPADCGAFLSGLGRHFTHNFIDKEIKLRVCRLPRQGREPTRLRLSCSAMKGMEYCSRLRLLRNCKAVCAEPVKLTTS